MEVRILKFPNSYWIEITERAGGQVGVVKRVGLLDVQEEAAACGLTELRQIEQRKMRPPKTAQRQRPEKCECSANSRVSSKRMGMNVGELYSDRPPTLIEKIP